MAKNNFCFHAILLVCVFFVQTKSAVGTERPMLDLYRLQDMVTRGELINAIDMLGRELEHQVELLTNHDHYTIIKNSLETMQPQQKYYLIALITNTVHNLHQFNSILDEIVYDDSENIHELMHNNKDIEALVDKRSLKNVLLSKIK
jgi:hypothetical protein